MEKYVPCSNDAAPTRWSLRNTFSLRNYLAACRQTHGRHTVRSCMCGSAFRSKKIEKKLLYMLQAVSEFQAICKWPRPYAVEEGSFNLFCLPQHRIRPFANGLNSDMACNIYIDPKMVCIRGCRVFQSSGLHRNAGFHLIYQQQYNTIAIWN